MVTLSLSTQQQPLLPLDPPTNLAVSSATAKTMRMMLETGVPPHIIAGLLRVAGSPPEHVRYLSGPVILPNSPWSDSLPDWLSPAIYSDRLAVILTEYSVGIVGNLATPAEVLAYLYPQTLEAPLPEDWQRIYRWVGQETLPRHGQMSRPDFLIRMHNGLPVTLDVYARQRLRRLQFDIRRKVVAAAVEPVTPALPAPDLFPSSMQPELEGVSL